MKVSARPSWLAPTEQEREIGQEWLDRHIHEASLLHGYSQFVHRVSPRLGRTGELTKKKESRIVWSTAIGGDCKIMEQQMTTRWQVYLCMSQQRLHGLR